MPRTYALFLTLVEQDRSCGLDRNQTRVKDQTYRAAADSESAAHASLIGLQLAPCMMTAIPGNVL